MYFLLFNFTCQLFCKVVEQLYICLGSQDSFSLSLLYFRDDYVKIMENNIEPSKKHNFAKRNWSEIEYSDVAYDYKSVMHYDMYGASKQPVSIPTELPGFLLAHSLIS